MKDYIIRENFLSKEFCDELVMLSEAKGYDEADISYTSGARMNKEYRDNYRCLYRDENLRVQLESLVLEMAPKEVTFIQEGGVLIKKELLGLSGNFRFYKYLPGNKFKKHRDTNQLEEGGVSLYTVLFYLNDVEEGGETAVYDPSLENRILVKAETGKLLIFNHTIVHTGEEVTKGIKYVLRTDLIYKV